MPLPFRRNELGSPDSSSRSWQMCTCLHSIVSKNQPSSASDSAPRNPQPFLQGSTPSSITRHDHINQAPPRGGHSEILHQTLIIRRRSLEGALRLQLRGTVQPEQNSCSKTFSASTPKMTKINSNQINHFICPHSVITPAESALEPTLSLCRRSRLGIADRRTVQLDRDSRVISRRHYLGWHCCGGVSEPLIITGILRGE